MIRVALPVPVVKKSDQKAMGCHGFQLEFPTVPSKEDA